MDIFALVLIGLGLVFALTGFLRGALAVRGQLPSGAGAGMAYISAVFNTVGGVILLVMYT